MKKALPKVATVTLLSLGGGACTPMPTTPDAGSDASVSMSDAGGADAGEPFDAGQCEFDYCFRARAPDGGYLWESDGGPVCYCAV